MQMHVTVYSADLSMMSMLSWFCWAHLKTAVYAVLHMLLVILHLRIYTARKVKNRKHAVW